MSTLAKIFMSGRSQAVRLPKELRFSGDAVIARRLGNGVLLLPVDAPWQTLLQALDEFEPGFVMEREQPDGAQNRAEWPQ
jgi:antitoxin VapB